MRCWRWESTMIFHWDDICRLAKCLFDVFDTRPMFKYKYKINWVRFHIGDWTPPWHHGDNLLLSQRQLQHPLTLQRHPESQDETLTDRGYIRKMPNMTYLGKGLCRGSSFRAILGQLTHLGNWLSCKYPGHTRPSCPSSCRSWRWWGRRGGSWWPSRWTWSGPPAPVSGCCPGGPSKLPWSSFFLVFVLSFQFLVWPIPFSESHRHPSSLLLQLGLHHPGLLLILLARGILSPLRWGTLTLISLCSCIVWDNIERAVAAAAVFSAAWESESRLLGKRARSPQPSRAAVRRRVKRRKRNSQRTDDQKALWNIFSPGSGPHTWPRLRSRGFPSHVSKAHSNW